MLLITAVLAISCVATCTGTLLQGVKDIIQEIPDETCRRHSLMVLHEFQNFTDWAVKMVDASAKVPAGLLQGNLRQLGDFDECVSARGGADLRGQYCLANLRISASDGAWDRLVDAAMLGRRRLEITRGRTGPAVYPSFALTEWAVCVPASCRAQDVEVGLNAALRRLTSGSGLEMDALVLPSACQVTKSSEFNAGDFIMITILSLTLLLVIVGSIYDKYFEINDNNNKHSKAHWEEILVAFSVPTNWRRLVSVRSTPGAVGCIDGIRVLSTLWVIMTHKVMHLSQEPWVNKAAIASGIKDFPKMPLLNSMLNVDTFFVVSGLLRAYNVMGELEEGRFRYLTSLLQRYLRLSPAYFIMIGFYATLLMFVGSGPAWHENLGVNSEYCQENWLLNLLYVNNYIGTNRMCMLQSWYLSADMQLFLLAPLALYPLWRWPRIGKLLLTVLVGISVALPIATIIINRYPGMYHLGMHDQQIGAYMRYIYVATHNRMSPYLVGLALGYFLRKLQHKEISLAKVWVVLGWVMSSLLLLAVVFGPYSIMQMDHAYDVAENALYGGLHRLAWAVAVAWLVFACHKGYGGIVNSILNAEVFRPLSRLSYCIYLTHIAVLLFGSSRIRNPIWLDEFLLMHNYIGDVCIMLMVSVVLYLAYESPFFAITRILFPKSKSMEKVQKPENTGISTIQLKLNENSMTDRH